MRNNKLIIAVFVGAFIFTSCEKESLETELLNEVDTRQEILEKRGNKIITCISDIEGTWKIDSYKEKRCGKWKKTDFIGHEFFLGEHYAYWYMAQKFTFTASDKKVKVEGGEYSMLYDILDTEVYDLGRLIIKSKDYGEKEDSKYKVRFRGKYLIFKNIDANKVVYYRFVRS